MTKLKSFIETHFYIKRDDKIRKSVLITKIVAAVIFTAVYLLIFIQGLYKVDGHIHIFRILIPTVLWLFGLLTLVVRVRLSETANNVFMLVYSIGVVYATFFLSQVSQEFAWRGLSIRAIHLNVLIIASIFLIVYCIFNSFKVAIIFVTVFNVIFAMVNYYVTAFRGPAFLAVDLVDVGTATKVAVGYDYSLSFYMVFLILTSFVICFIAVGMGKNTLTTKRWRVVPIILALLVTARCAYTYFGTDEFDSFLKIKYYKPQERMVYRGMYATLMKSCKDLIVEPPEGYSVEGIEKLADKYETKYVAKPDKDKPNIIMIMDEAFTDFSSFAELKTNEQVVPFFHNLKENTIRGQLFASIFGGGTVATEFEALTANTMGFIPGGITPYTTYINDPMNSLADDLKTQGYGGIIAMHPFNRDGYKRDKVYPLLGFDKFISQGYFAKNTDVVGKHISDKGNFERIIEEYEKFRKTNKTSPFFLFDVTIQNHSPFLSGNVSGNIKVNYPGLDIPETKEYMNLLRHSDNAFKELVNHFKNKKEKTIILFFGDHEPRLEDDFYAEIQKTTNVPEAWTKLERRNTQYVLWANYDIKEKEGYDLSANYLAPLLLDTAKLQKTGYEKIVSETQKKVPIMTKYGYVGDDGNFYEVEDEKSPYYNVLANYRNSHYNNMFDTKNRVERLFKINK